MAHDDDLRLALSDLTPRERQAMQRQAAEAASRWAGPLPRVARVWHAFAATVQDIDANERARRAGDR
jgi:hypothetical protein